MTIQTIIIIITIMAMITEEVQQEAIVVMTIIPILFSEPPANIVFVVHISKNEETYVHKYRNTPKSSTIS